MAKTLKEQYGHLMMEMAQKSVSAAVIDETSVYEEGNPESRKYMNVLLKDNVLPESGFANIENVKKFYDTVVKEGKSGVIMVDHYSNLDLPIIIYLLENYGEEWTSDLAKRIVAIAGKKLNEDSPAVRALTEGYTRVVIYPTRSIRTIEASDLPEEEKKAEEQRARKINFSAMRAMDTCKKNGQVILVFPSGTRYRPGKPETKKGLREIDSYLRLFDVMLLISINGNCLRINPDEPENMLADLVYQDKITLTASDIIETKSFRNNILEKVPADHPNPKQETVNGVMQILEELHQKNM